MENFTLAQLLPIDSGFAVDVNSLSSNVDVNNLPTSHLHNHHKDHMLAAGATPNLIYECISHKCDPIITTTTATTSTTTTTCADTTSSGKTLISMKSDYTAFTNCIQQSALLDQRSGTVDISIDAVSLSSFCDLKFNSSPSIINGSVTPANDNAVITSVRDLTPHNFKGIQLIEPKSTITNNSSDLNDDLPNNFSGNALFFSNNLTHHIQAVAPKSVFETNLPQYYNLTKLTSNGSIYQELPNATTKTTNNQHFDISLNNSESNNVDNNNTSQLVNNNNNKNNNHNINNMDTQNLERSSNNNHNNNTLPIYLIANDDGSTTNTANMVQNAYTNTHQQQQPQPQPQQQQQQQQHQHQYKNQNQQKRTKKKLLTTTTTAANTTIITAKTTTTTTTTTAKTIITTAIENNNNQQQQQQEQHCPIVTNIELISRITTTAITTSTSTATTITVSALTINPNNNASTTPTPTTTTTTTLTNAAILSDCNSSNIDDNQMQQKNKYQNKCKTNNLNLQNNSNKQDDSSDCDDTDSMSCSDDYIDIEMNGCFGYQDNTSSHSQQSAGAASVGGNTANTTGSAGNNTNVNSASVSLLNGVVAGGGGSANNPNASSAAAAAVAAAGGYMSLLPHGVGVGSAASSSAHLSGTTVAGGGSGVNANTAAGSGGEGIDFKHLFEELCPVCGDKVSGYHYGLLTCESCKGFFKRTVQNKKVYTCVAERSCHIDKTQRKRCPYCRFQKCLEVGMKLEAVRADRMRGGRNKFGPMYKRDRARKLQMMRQRQLALQALRTSIGSADMKATPLSPGYQQAYPNINIKQEIQIPQVSSLTQSPDSSPSPIAIALGQVNASSGGGVIATPMNGNGSGGGNGGGGGNGNNGNNTNSDGMNRNGSGNCHDPSTAAMQNSSESKLCFDSGTHPSSTADAIIEPLRVSPMIRDFVQSIDDREWQTQLFALLQKQTYNQVEVDLFELMCKVLDQNLFSQVDWARNTVFFKDLKVDDQMKLLQHSWSDMLVLDHLHQRIHNGLPDETHLNNGQVFNLLYLGLLGVPQLTDYFNELQNKLQDLKFDMGDYVCMKFLILLNPDVRGIINKKTVLEGHENVQAALLDYTLTCYPSVTDKFRRLLNILPDIHAMAARGEEHLYSKHCAGSAPTQTLLMEMLHAKRKV